MSTAQQPRDVPEGCVEIPGFLIVVADGEAWLTRDGRVTAVWSERGVWPTVEEASEAAGRSLAPRAP